MSDSIYKNLPPVERKRDGSLYRMNPAPVNVIVFVKSN